MAPVSKVRSITLRRAAAILSIVALHSTSALAGTSFSFSFSAGTHTASGLLDAVLQSDGTYLVDGVTGTMDGLALSLLPQTPATFQVPGLPPLFESGNWAYDDLILPGTDPQLDPGGIGLQTSATTFNLNGYDAAFSTLFSFPQGYFYADDQLEAATLAGTFTSPIAPYIPATVSLRATPVPEPGTAMLLAIGLLSLVAYRQAQRSELG